VTTPSTTQTALTSDTQRFLDRLGFFGWQLGLERIEKLCQFFGQPQLSYPTVHIAGTNGKGSTAAMLAAITNAAGLRTGLYTSPHLVELNERIQIDGVPVAYGEIENTLRHCRPLAESLQATYFEILTAIALAIFAQRRVDVAIIETGLGGRLDATNVVQPQLTIITTIGLEHQRYLGRTLAQIAGEKAGIIKHGVPCISGVRQKSARERILEQCRQRDTPFYDLHEQAKIKNIDISTTGLKLAIELPDFGLRLTDLECSLTGRHQANNAALAVLAAALLRKQHFSIGNEAISHGLKSVCWPARFQLIRRKEMILIDAAHNADGMRALTRNVAEIFPQRRLLVVMGLLRDKPLRPILRIWQELQPRFFFATPPTERARAALHLAQAAKSLGFMAEALDSSVEAFECARRNCGDEDILCVTGSHYLIGELMKLKLLPYPCHCLHQTN
jgi:dihydrofolate synthase/folylpolyglutamate synthase